MPSHDQFSELSKFVRRLNTEGHLVLTSNWLGSLPAAYYLSTSFYQNHIIVIPGKMVAVVTGSSSGIGYEISVTLARSGIITYATMRNLEKGHEIRSIAAKDRLPIRIVQLDVRDEASVSNAVQEILSEAERIDILVNNAGYALVGAFEDLSMEEIRNQFETNLFGTIRVSQAVIPTMRRQHSGRIINISASAGRLGYPFSSAYVSTKFAIEGLAECMSYELEPFGIKVILVEPGFVRTNFNTAAVIAKQSQEPSSPYGSMMHKVLENSMKMMPNASPPELIAKIVLEAATSPHPDIRYPVGKDIEILLESRRKLSDKEFYDLIKQNLLS